jgi:predicted dinucleotide-utilizing enzyme
MKSIGIVGLGAIGRAVLAAVDDGRLKVTVAGVTSRS